MGFDEGMIVLNSENETFFAGQTIFGKLVFEQDKVKTFRGMFVKVKGYCKVHWTTTETRRRHGLNHHGHGLNHHNRTYTHVEHHDSYEEYFSRKIFLLGGENGEYHLQPGKHELPFDCPIPINCPSSYEGTYGHVRYEIKIVVDRAFKLDQEKTKRVRVIAPLDLNANPYCKEPMQFDIEDTYCCCCMSSGSSETIVKLPLSGYCPGQTIPIEINCSNQGRVEVQNIKLAIKKRVTYHATQSPGTKHESDVVAEIKKGPIPGGTTRNWMVDMCVPVMDIYNMAPCRYIDIEYDFKVTVSPDGCHSDSDDTRSIIIGTVPIVGQQDNIPNPLLDQMPKQVTPIMNQPFPAVNPYPPQSSPYPGQNPGYPGQIQPYPGHNAPYPQPNPPYPGHNTAYPGQNSPYPSQNSPYPAPKQPYPNVTPYPITNSPSSYPVNAQAGRELKTGTFGFNVPTPNAMAPTLPPGINLPYPPDPPSNPYATASAPEPGTPDALKNSSGPGAKNTIPDPNPPYNPEYDRKNNK